MIFGRFFELAKKLVLGPLYSTAVKALSSRVVGTASSLRLEYLPPCKQMDRQLRGSTVNGRYHIYHNHCDPRWKKINFS